MLTVRNLLSTQYSDIVLFLVITNQASIKIDKEINLKTIKYTISVNVFIYFAQ